MENKPVFPTSFVAISAKLSMSFEHTDFFSSHDVASASAIALFDMGLPAAFMVFMGAIARPFAWAWEMLCANWSSHVLCVD